MIMNKTFLLIQILQHNISYHFMQFYCDSCNKYTASKDHNCCNISSETKGSMFLAHLSYNGSIQHFEKRRNTQEKKTISIDSVNTQKQTSLITKCWWVLAWMLFIRQSRHCRLCTFFIWLYHFLQILSRQHIYLNVYLLTYHHIWTNKCLFSLIWVYSFS